ncbi:MAG: chorion class high-cysteine HCB protein 13 [Lachnospiraceae bacterium]|nr:chorion class high-cysteine HCB protein 13 [Lachnospiraceae bacterium]
MSDLTASNCGCSGNEGRSGNNNLIWIILLLAFCNGNNGIGLLNNNDGWGNNNSCDLLIWILLISCFCGGCNN